MTEKWGEIRGKLDLDRVLRVRVIGVLLYDDREGLEDAVHMKEKTRKVQREKRKVPLLALPWVHADHNAPCLPHKILHNRNLVPRVSLLPVSVSRSVGTGRREP